MSALYRRRQHLYKLVLRRRNLGDGGRPRDIEDDALDRYTMDQTTPYDGPP